MSYVDKAKKEAKRLLTLSKNSNRVAGKSESSITINNLNDCLKIISLINGYKNWHDYRLNLERKDMMSNKKDLNLQRKENKEIIYEKDYFLQNMPLLTYSYRKNEYITSNIKKHIPIVIGHKKEKNNSILSLNKQEKKGWLLTEYPVYIQGNAGSGKTETLLSFCHEYIKNNEGVIYISNGDNSVYSKLFYCAKKAERIQDLYLLNLDKISKNGLLKEKTISHTIDPLNSMNGCQYYFINLFGEKIGNIIHSMVKVLNANNEMLTVQSLPSFLMIKNLIEWQKKYQLKEIELYLNFINYQNEINEEVLNNHIKECLNAYNIIKTILEYQHLFSHTPSIDMIDIFKQRKILVISSKSAEKHELSVMLNSFCDMILFTSERLNDVGHLQNIVLNDSAYYLNNSNIKVLLNITEKSENNYIFGSCSYHNYPGNEFVMEISKTFLCMHSSSDSLPLYLKMQALDNMQSVPPLFYNIRTRNFKDTQWSPPEDLNPGYMYVFSNNKNINEGNIINNEIKYYIEKILAIYKIPDDYKIDNVYLIAHN